LKTEQLYNSCTDLNSLIGLIKRHRPPINLLTAIIYCNKVSSNEWIYDILGEALSIALSLVVDSDTLSRSTVTYTPHGGYEGGPFLRRFNSIKPSS
jgi:hypothetical protein